MSANVWFEQVDRGLMNEIRSCVKYLNKSGVPTALNTNQIIVRKPEEDFKIETYPCVSIYNVGYYHDPIRYNPEPVVVSKDLENHVVTLEDSAVSFNLEYQLDFWAKYQTDMNEMTKTWLTKHFRQFNLSVEDDGGVLRSCNCLIQGSVVKSDLVEGKERIFHSIIKYSIWVELDGENRYNKYIVAEREIDANEKEKEV